MNITDINNVMNIINITDINDERVALYNVRSEGELKHALEPEPGYFVVESDKCIIRAIDAGYKVVSFFVEAEMMDRFAALFSALNDSSIAPAADFGLDSDIQSVSCESVNQLPVYLASHDVIKSVTGYNLTGGILCLFRRRIDEPVGSLLDTCRRVVVLDDIENPTNLGSIFRSAAALNVDLVLLTNDSTDPLYRRSNRVSMGTVFQIPWVMLPAHRKVFTELDPDDSKADYMGILHAHGFKTAAMALTSDSVDIDDSALNSEEKLAIIMGNEGHGLSDEIIRDTDYTVCIPMSHDVDSLNVAVASAIAFWQLCR